MIFPDLERITIDPKVMGGKPWIRGIRITVGTITGLLASGETIEKILELYPYLEKEDVYAGVVKMSGLLSNFIFQRDMFLFRYEKRISNIEQGIKNGEVNLKN